VPSVNKLLAVVLLLILSPIISLGLLMSFIFISRNPIFRQDRFGQNQKIFKIYKIKTMFDLHGKKSLNQLPFTIPLVGKVLRRLKIDELLNLLNVATGTMNFVGPRAKLKKEVRRFPQFASCRQSIKPGITGYAQVNGNNKLQLKEMIWLDVYYVKRRSFVLDINILIKTLGICIFGEQINSSAIISAKKYVNSLYRCS